MSTIIKFDLKELRKLTYDKNCCVYEKKVTQNLALQPWCLGDINKSIKNLLDYKIGKFDKEFSGILLSYKNLKILQNVGTIRNDNADVHFLIQADYFIFRPFVGATLQGVVNKKSLTHLGILVHRVFNVVITRPTEEPGNKWIGESVQEGQQVIFKVVVLDLYGALPYIRGELDERYLLDGDEDNEDFKYLEPVNVSYVNFEKTKPLPAKQIGVDLTDTLITKPTKNQCSESDTPDKNILASNELEKVKEIKSNGKIKNKRQLKNDTVIQDVSPKKLKKHKL